MVTKQLRGRRRFKRNPSTVLRYL
jgi:hypothetical protein